MTPNMLRSLAALLTALAVVLSGAADGHIDPTKLVEAASAFFAVVSIVEAAVRSHDANAHAPATTGAGELGK